MAHIPLPEHVIAKAERRWANKLQEDIQAWTNGRLGSGQTKRNIVRDEHRTIPVTIKRGRRVKAPHA